MYYIVLWNGLKRKECIFLWKDHGVYWKFGTELIFKQTKTKYENFVCSVWIFSFKIVWYIFAFGSLVYFLILAPVRFVMRTLYFSLYTIQWIKLLSFSTLSFTPQILNCFTKTMEEIQNDEKSNSGNDSARPWQSYNTVYTNAKAGFISLDFKFQYYSYSISPI